MRPKTTTTLAVALALCLSPPVTAQGLLGLLQEIPSAHDAPVETDPPRGIVALFCGYGTSSGGAVRELVFCGLGGELESKFPRTKIAYSIAGGEAEASAEGAPDVDFTRTTFGLETRFGKLLLEGEDFRRFTAGAYAHRGTAIVSVEQLGGIDVVGVEYGPGVSFGVAWAVVHGSPIKTTLNWEWVAKAPKPQTGGACLSWGPIEFCGTRTKIGGRQVKGWTVKAFLLLGKR